MTSKKKRTETARALCAGVSLLKDEAIELAEQVLFMSEKLKEERKQLEKEPLIIEYDNGGGQMGIRENPHYTAYEKLLSSYNKSFKQLTEIIENGAPVKQKAGIMTELSAIASRKMG